MKKKLIGGVTVLFIMLTAVSTLFAAPTESQSKVEVPERNTYTGVVYGDKGTSAPLSLTTSQTGNLVSGTVYLGDGLYIDAGRCGGGFVPAAVQSAKGEVNKFNPNKFEASTAFKVSGFRVTIDLEGTLSSDGEVLETEAVVDIPWLCGSDPVISGTLYKQS